MIRAGLVVFAVAVGMIAGPAYAYVSPLKQQNAGFFPDEVICREGFLLMSNPDGSSACFMESSTEKIESKGWSQVQPKNSLIITQQDSEMTISLEPAQRFLLNLSDFYDWKVEIDDLATVHPFQNFVKQKDVQGIYEAHVPGNATLSAVGDPFCLRLEPACRVASVLFTLDIEVGESMAQDHMPGHMQMANPASVYCEENGGRLELRDTASGQQGICVFENGSECDEWKYFRGECSPQDD